MKLLAGIALSIIVYIISWHQLYGQFIHEYFKKYQWCLLLCSIPVTWLSIKSVGYISEYYDGKMWPNRMFTFSVGIIMFTLLTSIYFNERLTLKTVTLLLLSCVIVVLQIFWKWKSYYILLRWRCWFRAALHCDILLKTQSIKCQKMPQSPE